MTLLDAMALLAIMAGLAAVPSASVAFVLGRSATSGFSSGAAAATGIVAGDLLFVAFAILGMTALADVLGSAFVVLRYFGGAYLIWLGIGLIRTKDTSNVCPVDVSATSLSKSFFGGFVLTLGDVKAILFYASLFPAFVDMAALSASDIVTVLLVTAITVGGVKLLYAYGATRTVTMSNGLVPAKGAKSLVGALMIGTGASIIVKA